MLTKLSLIASLVIREYSWAILCLSAIGGEILVRWLFIESAPKLALKFVVGITDLLRLGIALAMHIKSNTLTTVSKNGNIFVIFQIINKNLLLRRCSWCMRRTSPRSATLSFVFDLGWFGEGD